MLNPDQNMRIGYFGGSFDPIQLGHIDTADEFLSQDIVDSILFSPCGLHAFGKQYGASDEQRLDLIQLGVDYLNNKWESLGKHAVVWKWEIYKKEVCYTYEALLELQKLFPQAIICFLGGADLLQGLKTWQNWEEIIGEFPSYFRPRVGADMSWIPGGAEIIKAKEINGASGQLKKLIQTGQDITGWVLPEQEEYMHRTGAYGYIRPNS